MGFLKYLTTINEGGDSGATRYSSELGVLWAFAGANEITNTEELFSEESWNLEILNTSFMKNLEIVKTSFDLALFNKFVKVGETIKKDYSALKYSWVGGLNKSEEFDPSDIGFSSESEFSGISVKANDSTTLANLTPKLIDDTEGISDIFIKNAKTEFDVLWTKIVTEYLAEVRKSKGIVQSEPKRKKYSVTYIDDNNFQINLGDKNKTFTEEEILNGKIPSLYNRPFGNYFITNVDKFIEEKEAFYNSLKDVLLTKIKVSLVTNLGKILNIGTKPYIYATDKKIVEVKTKDAIKDIKARVCPNVTKDSTGIQFTITLYDDEGDKASLLLYLRYAQGVFVGAPTIRVQSPVGLENIIWNYKTTNKKKKFKSCPIGESFIALLEGGNVTGTIKKTGENTRAQKIQIAKIGRAELLKKSLELFNKINSLFEKKFKEKLWKNEEHLKTGFMFNGSTSFIMDPTISDEEIIKAKPSAGDFDIAIPQELGENLWVLLDELEDKEIIPGVTYKGNNRPTIKSITDQINCVFIMDFPNGERSWAQVDFELLEFKDDTPTEWAKFGHSSSFEDASGSVAVKAVFHKYLIRSLASSVSMRKDAVIVTPSSTYEKFKIKKVADGDIPRMLKFHVTKGIRYAYEPLLDPSGKQVMIDGKFAIKEIDSKIADYETIIAEIYSLVFNDKEQNPSDVKLFSSFKGITKLIKEKLSKDTQDDVIARMEQLLWDKKLGQELEVEDPKTDFEVKISAYNYLIGELGRKMTPKTQELIDEYYAGYGKRKSFVSESTTFSSYIKSLSFYK